MLWVIDEAKSEALTVGYPYFEIADPTVFHEPGTYVDSDHEFVHTRSAGWNHGLGETAAAVLAAGMRVTLLEEHRSAPWMALPHRMERTDFNEWQLTEHGDLLPLTHTLRALKEG